ncbi:CAP domain-containing protein [Pseudanabaena sp. FACHB-2040]|uniref:CAP domain-containing protein n=1 Tax=Pseudanabaena sp. FACHB-2040 TaxID=2692859 RepID=UPI0016838529|nr:CAP domain-containing protein [Pseudanabaena sp. FACHB-2040]MBD2256509.1 CAP domain-containing protein [Pseudanabaena sp. FACHB-2040]
MPRSIYSKSLVAGLGCFLGLLASCSPLPTQPSPPQSQPGAGVPQPSPSPQPGAGASQPSPSQPTVAAAQSEATAQLEAQVAQQINAIRQEQGLSALSNNQRLAQVARNYSRRMAEEGFFAHTSPRGDTLVDRVQSAGITYLAIGENLYTSTNIPQPATAAVDGWMNSPGHRENILRSEYRETGIGVWQVGNTYYFTQLFLRSR